MPGKFKTGVYEWAEHKVNFDDCEYNCRYCYEKARKRRFNIAPSGLRMKNVPAKRKFEPGVWMIPTTHDITPRNISCAITVLRNVLKEGNKVLLVSKPRLECIKEICKIFDDVAFAPFKMNFEFRFTITSIDAQIAAFWEPGAPEPAERIQCLQFAFAKGFKTSVSAEPLLGGDIQANFIYNHTEKLITESIWFGKMNKIDQRVMADSPEVEQQIYRIKIVQGDSSIRRLYQDLKDKPLVKFKDSIKKVVGIPLEENGPSNEVSSVQNIHSDASLF